MTAALTSCEDPVRAHTYSPWTAPGAEGAVYCVSCCCHCESQRLQSWRRFVPARQTGTSYTGDTGSVLPGLGGTQGHEESRSPLFPRVSLLRR